MTRPIDRFTILPRLDELDRKDRRRRVFGAASHQYKLNPPLSVSVLEQFEKLHGVWLPADYRFFITEIGNGGAGPFYGLFPFGRHDDGHGLCDWEGGGLIGDPSKPFLHITAWNLPESFWKDAPNPLPDIPLEEEDRLMEAWDRKLEAHYWNPAIMDGAIPICHKGCALRQWLVIHGDQRGFVWDDNRVDNAGIAPVLDESGEPVTFADWYMGWLDDSIRGMGVLPSPPAVPWWRRFSRRR
jgi:hypothetical protein